MVREDLLEEASFELRSEGRIGVIQVRNGRKNLWGRATAYAQALRLERASSVLELSDDECG